MDHINQFNKLWQDFLVKLKAQIRKRSAAGLPSVKQMNMILEDCALDWAAADTICGRWLMNYEAENPDQGRLIRRILLEDMHFQECEAQQAIPEAVQIAVPAVGAMAGLALSRFMHAGVAMQAVSALVPAVALSPAMKQLDNQLRSKNAQKQTEAYLMQMELYYRSIVSVLENQ